MYENLAAILIVVLITCTAKNKYLLGVLVACYYGVYILLELDFHGFTVGNVFPGYKESIIWYLIYTAISFLFFLALIIIFIYTKSKTALFYSIWILFNIVISGVSAVFQSFETNSFLFVYNCVQNVNLCIDLLVVVIGTDNFIRNTSSVTGFINYIDTFISRFRAGNITDRNRIISCRKKN